MNKKAVLIIGAGKIGSLVACLFAGQKDYQVHLADVQLENLDTQRVLAAYPKIVTKIMDVNNTEEVLVYIKQHRISAVVPCLPFYANIAVAHIAQQAKIHYFDLTEDTKITAQVKKLAQGASTAFVPQCGLAPGFISIVANEVMQRFDEVHTAKLRVGALPQYVHNALYYALTWSTEGLINQYANSCHAIVSGKEVELPPLSSLEEIKLDGLTYEAFTTSGGLGSLAETYAGRLKNLGYKTLRYPGHCERMCILMEDLRLKEDPETLKRILENAVPKTYQDVVIVYVSVNGMRDGVFVEEHYMEKIYPRRIDDIHWTAIQITTAAGLCAVVDMVLANPDSYTGLVLQENINFDEFLNNRFGQYFTNAT